MDMEQLGEALHIDKATVENRRMSGKLGIPTFKPAGKRVADIKHVAQYLDALSSQAALELEQERSKLAS